MEDTRKRDADRMAKRDKKKRRRTAEEEGQEWTNQSNNVRIPKPSRDHSGNTLISQECLPLSHLLLIRAAGASFYTGCVSLVVTASSRPIVALLLLGTPNQILMKPMLELLKAFHRANLAFCLFLPPPVCLLLGFFVWMHLRPCWISQYLITCVWS